MSGILYVTGTPIGNLSDMSPRAVQTLESVDFIAAEDTRVTLKLLNHFGIKKPMVSYYEHNKRERGEMICKRIEEGESCAIVTDAGVVTDGQFITSKGLGTAIDFSLELITLLVNAETAENIAKAVQYK